MKDVRLSKGQKESKRERERGGGEGGELRR